MRLKIIKKNKKIKNIPKIEEEMLDVSEYCFDIYSILNSEIESLD
jgi:hypothetical protein